MIRIMNIHIEEFRGVRKLDLRLNKENFGICGPNGTGKSGVVDAIEFCLTGNISRLSGTGRGDLGVKTYSAHVDRRRHPEKASVKIEAEIPSLGRTVKIERSVKNPKKAKISPEDTEVMRVIEQLQTHPELALSRREIVKYIITQPNERSKAVQNLLRLEHLDNLRKSLTTFSNKCKTEADGAESNSRQAESELRTALMVDSLDRSHVLQQVNKRREILGLKPLAELMKDTSFKTGVPVQKQEDDQLVLRKTAALSDLSALQSAVKEGTPAALANSQQAAKSVLNKLKDDEQALKLARRYGFIKTGLDLVTEDACPLCDTEWNAKELRQYLHAKLLGAEETEQVLAQLRHYINGILESTLERRKAIEKTIHYGEALKPALDTSRLKPYLQLITEAETVLRGFLEDHNRIELALRAVELSWWLPSAEQQNCIDECYAAVNALPDSSEEDEAREFLIVSQERYERLLKIEKTEKEMKARCALAQKVLEHYNDSFTSVLESIYDEVAEDFSRFYRMINHEDEEKFVCKLKSEPPKLSFEVDFYERGLFPPGAYHSEGHQDGMGLCLYLALMRHTLRDDFTFAVLDDVLMSVDTGHRREVCRLLKSEFANTQFILTTHDKVWLQYMKTEGLVSQTKSFGGWSVDTGPRVLDEKDTWDEIQSELDRNDVAKAASLLRWYLEYTATILAGNLRAHVEFRGDGRYDLGDLMPPALKAWRTLLAAGVKSAAHWKRETEQASLEARHTKAKERIARSKVEDWAINPSVHFNQWANFHPHEFRAVVDSFKELLEDLRCKNENCKSYLYVLPAKGTREELRCNCGESNINLKPSA